MHVFHMFQKLEERLNMLTIDVFNFEKTHTEFLEMNTTMSKMKNTLLTLRMDVSEYQKKK